MQIDKVFQEYIDGALAYGPGGTTAGNFLELADQFIDQEDEPLRSVLVAYARMRFLGIDDMTARKVLSECGQDEFELDGLSLQYKRLSQGE